MARRSKIQHRPSAAGDRGTGSVPSGRPRYRTLNAWLRGIFGVRVHKVALDAGLTCPNRDGTLSSAGCVYCNARGSGTGAFARGQSIRRQLERGREMARRRFKARKFIAYFQSFSNTYAPPDRLRALWDEALGVQDVVGLAVGTRPDCAGEAVLDLLADYARRCLVWVEYGLQSAHDRTLERINRGHGFADFERAVTATRNRGVHVCAHVILGLPGEDRQQMLATADALAALDVDAVKLHLLYVVRDTALETDYRSGRYRCLERDAYVDLVCDFLERLPPRTVIQRLTGDPHRDELVAPRWALEKRRTLDAIRQRLETRDIRQGRRFAGP